MVILFGCRGFEMAGEAIAACIVYFCLINTTDSCFMDSMVEYPNCENGALGAGFCKARKSCFDASMTLSAHDGKGMVK